MTIPLIILSHRGDEYIHETIGSIREFLIGDVEDYIIFVVDDSGATGDPYVHPKNRAIYVPSGVSGNPESLGYLEAMREVFAFGAFIADARDASYVMLWEEDFRLTRRVWLSNMIKVMEAPGNERLAHLNLQRQAVYGVEKRLGYMESHQRRGYGLERLRSDDVAWVRRQRPFTTNPGLIRAEVLATPWPTREEADAVDGGAEPAMSQRLEEAGWHFGWLGPWNVAQTEHVGDERKSGKGY